MHSRQLHYFQETDYIRLLHWMTERICTRWLHVYDFITTNSWLVYMLPLIPSLRPLLDFTMWFSSVKTIVIWNDVVKTTMVIVFIVIVTVIYSFIVVIFLLITMHFIHLFSILLPVCFNKFSVQCSMVEEPDDDRIFPIGLAVLTQLWNVTDNLQQSTLT